MLTTEASLMLLIFSHRSLLHMAAWAQAEEQEKCHNKEKYINRSNHIKCPYSKWRLASGLATQFEDPYFGNFCLKYFLFYSFQVDPTCLTSTIIEVAAAYNIRSFPMTKGEISLHSSQQLPGMGTIEGKYTCLLHRPYKCLMVAQVIISWCESGLQPKY